MSDRPTDPRGFPPESPGRRAFDFGLRLGATHTRIWDSPERAAAEHHAQVSGFTQAEAARALGPAGLKVRLLTWGLFAGVVLGGAFSGSTEGTSSGTVWLVLGVIMGIGWFLVVGARSIEWLMRDRESLAESLTHHVWDGFAEEIGRRRAEARDHVPAGSAAGAALPPAPQPFGVSDAGAEALVCTWMQHLGQADAEVTRFSGDGGIDVGSTHYVAQVKNYAGTVGVTAIRELFGVATADGRRPLFFTSGGYTSEAESFAARIAMPLFTYNAAEGTVGGANVAAEDLLETGL